MEKRITIIKKNQSAASPQNLNEHVQDAYKEAGKDISKDADLSIHSPNDDLDEGELAHLGGDKNDLV